MIRCILFISFYHVIIAESFTEKLVNKISTWGDLLISQFPYIDCLHSECCSPFSKWIPFNITKLEDDIQNNLYGQHLVKNVLLKNLKYHVFNKKPTKALLLSFNGMPGTGKNFVSSMIANSLFKNGMKSKFVHFFHSGNDFPNSNKLEEYKEALKARIIDAVTRCEYNLFIFDEVHDMPSKLLDVIKPFADVHENVHGLDFRKSIFIFLSVSGGVDINGKFVEHFQRGKERESLTLKEMEDVLERILYNMKDDGLRRSKLISHSLISAFVPFLPLEEKHVRLCIDRHLRNRMLPGNDRLMKEIIESLNFDNSSGVLLAKQGCKRIEDRFDQIFEGN